jgi:hypothetical protein
MHNTDTKTPTRSIQIPDRLRKDGWWLEEEDHIPTPTLRRRSVVRAFKLIEGGLKESVNDRNYRGGTNAK